MGYIGLHQVTLGCIGLHQVTLGCIGLYIVVYGLPFGSDKGVKVSRWSSGRTLGYEVVVGLTLTSSCVRPVCNGVRGCLQHPDSNVWVRA